MSLSGGCEDALRDQTLHAAKHELQAERHLVDSEDHAEEQQQRAEPADNGVCDEHSEPVQEQNEINNTGHHESDFGRWSERDENDNRCDAVGSNDGWKCEWGESVRQSGRLSTIGRVGYVVLMHHRLQCDEEKD